MEYIKASQSLQYRVYEAIVSRVDQTCTPRPLSFATDLITFILTRNTGSKEIVDESCDDCGPSSIGNQARRFL